MKIKYLAHASFLVTSDSGTRIVMDPYKAGGPLAYKPVSETADIVTSSHDHGDHNAVSSVKGNPAVLRQSGRTTVKGIAVNGIDAFHDADQGKQRGRNVIFCLDIDGIRLCHMGDLGHPLSQEQTAQIGAVDVLMLPVGGTYTVDAAGATAVYQSLKPGLTIPMHYKTPGTSYPLAEVDSFLEGKKNVERARGSEITLDKASLPEGKIVVLQPALGG